MYLYLLTRDLKRGRVRIPHVYFFHERDVFKYHYCLRRLFIVFLLYFKCFYYSILITIFSISASTAMSASRYFLSTSSTCLQLETQSSSVTMSQLYNIRHLKIYISSGDVSFHRCPDQLYRIEVCMVSREPEAVMSILF